MSDFETGAPAPAAPVVPDAPASPAPVSTAEQPAADQGSGTPAPEAPKERTFTQAELDKIVAKRAAQESRRAERAARAEAEADFLRRQLEQRDAPAKQTDGRPKAEDFGNDFEKYHEALTDWKVDQKLKGLEQKTAKERAAAEERQFVARISEKLRAGYEEFEDFEDVVFGADSLFTKDMAAAIGESDIGHRLAHHIGSDKKLFAELLRMSPARRVMEMARIEDRLKAPPATTKTPPPIVPNSAKASAVTDTFKKPWKEFHEERMKARRAQ